MHCLLHNYYVSSPQSILFIQFQLYCDGQVVLIPTSLKSTDSSEYILTFA